ncbi:MAG: hypothetical protein FWF95_06250 [Syntrophorhabdaceae bacterium]|nr:hypothetical protein [Syntrophorhabdaceae bacterium]
MPYATFDEALKNFMETPVDEIDKQALYIAETLPRKEAVALSKKFHLSAAEAMAVVLVFHGKNDLTEDEQWAWSRARHRMSELNQAAGVAAEEKSK